MDPRPHPFQLNMTEIPHQTALNPRENEHAGETHPVRQVRNIQVLRGVAAIAVVLFHIGLWESKAVGSNGVSPRVFSQGLVGVDLFFVISGFIMAYIQPLPLDTPRRYARFLAHRFARIYPPLWLVLIPLLVVYFIRPELINASNNHQVELLQSFLCMPQDHLPLLQVAWSLIYEVHFYFVVSIALILRPTYRVLFGIIWFLMVLGIYCAFWRGDFGGNRWLQVFFSPFSLTFLLGYFIGLWYSCRPASSIGIALSCGVLALCGLALAARYMPVDGYYPNINSLYRFFYYGIPCALLVLGAVLIENATQLRFVSLRHVGDESYAIYLLHVPILATISKGVIAVHSTNPFFLAGVIVASLRICIASGTFFHRYAELRVTRLARRLMEKLID